MTDAEKQQIRDRIAAWDRASEFLDAEKTARLRALTEEQSAREFDALTWPSESAWIAPERLASHGLIEQQRLFATVITQILEELTPLADLKEDPHILPRLRALFKKRDIPA